MAKKATGHGGKREGAGRPRTIADGMSVTVRLPAEVATKYVIAAASRGVTTAEVLRDVAITHAPEA